MYTIIDEICRYTHIYCAKIIHLEASAVEYEQLYIREQVQHE